MTANPPIIISLRTRDFVYADAAPTPSCHASTLALTGPSLLHAAWFGGSREGAGDVAIWYARRDPSGWSAPLKLAGEDDTPHWNPVLFNPGGDRLILFYKRGRTIARWQTWWMESADHGRTWSKPEALVPGDFGGRGPVKNKPIVLSDGSWLAPASLEQGTWTPYTDRAQGGGHYWKESAQLFLAPEQRASRAAYLQEGFASDRRWEKHGAIQPSLWESAPGIVHMLVRTSEGSIYRSDSADGGRTWRSLYPTELPSNNSGIDLVQLKNGFLVLAYNPVAENWGPRTPLVLSYSVDNGSDWRLGFILEDDIGEYSYPSIIADDRFLYISYTWKRERIVVCQLEYKFNS